MNIRTALLSSVFMLSIFGRSAVTAQTDCSAILNKAEAALIKEKNPRKAQSLLQDVETCDRKNLLLKKRQDLQKRIFDAIDKLRDEASTALQALQIIANQAVPIVLDDIDRNIYRLEYNATYEKCQTALGLNARRPEVEKRIWEIAYFYTEADTGAAAVAFLNLLKPTGLTAATPDLQQKLRDYLKKAVPAAYLDSLHKRYYPHTVLVEGGSFWQEIKSKNNVFRTRDSLDSLQIYVSDFYIGETEVTYWQFNIFMHAKKYFIQTPPWGFNGDNAVVYLNWFDAAFYLNWLSDQHGRKITYLLTPKHEFTLEIESAVFPDVYDVKIDSSSNGYRLPTEAEWEFIRIHNDIDPHSHLTESREAYLIQKVKQKKPNRLGIHDSIQSGDEFVHEEKPNKYSSQGNWGGFESQYHSSYRSMYANFRIVLAPQ